MAAGRTEEPARPRRALYGRRKRGGAGRRRLRDPRSPPPPPPRQKPAGASTESAASSRTRGRTGASRLAGAARRRLDYLTPARDPRTGSPPRRRAPRPPKWGPRTWTASI
ncbi:t101.1 [Tupaiid betaherpesvirus 1]|uniref:T101.1 n=1 Tax=Tupaiid herpesvirus 1 (strain 1) TaxID=10397 RepID=Q91TK2_TUHV1|nr:t101.1 [Tupaiid betaherpesvirus 1]AAK57145.1 t101.1 [Tupaiid betaherpesvirus 1]